jgi:hypothetical protein
MFSSNWRVARGRRLASVDQAKKPSGKQARDATRMNQSFEVTAEIVFRAGVFLLDTRQAEGPNLSVVLAMHGPAVGLAALDSARAASGAWAGEALRGAATPLVEGPSEGGGCLFFSCSQEAACRHLAEFGEGDAGSLVACPLPAGFAWLVYLRADGSNAVTHRCVVPIDVASIEQAVQEWRRKKGGGAAATDEPR